MVKIIAFYLPQYHPIPENDQWWGQGFTEWDNVRSAVPQFAGHHQPHVPHPTIGYYDLRDRDFLIRQHDIASQHGIFGFCYYYYYFNGRKPLETPLRLIRDTPEIRTNYCLCWANGNWTRAWYGQNKDILLSNEYSVPNALDFIRNVFPYFTDSRYIRIDGKPLLLIHEPELIPDIREYAQIWRGYAKRKGLDGIYLAAVEACMIGAHPGEYGFDAAVEFAPDWTRAHLLSDPKQHHRLFDYKATVRNMLLKPEPDYTRFGCIFPGWDNTPRYGKSAVTFVNSTPGAFKFFAEQAMARTRRVFPGDNQLLFVNAWNEWGEGCHIEPDALHGYTYLQILKELAS